MNPIRVLHRLALLAALLVSCDALAPEASAGVGGFFSGVSARGRIVQVCVAVAAFSLLIIMKKFSPDSRAFAPKMNYARTEMKTKGRPDTHHPGFRSAPSGATLGSPLRGSEGAA